MARSASAKPISALSPPRLQLKDVEAAYDFFANPRGGVLKVAITP